MGVWGVPDGNLAALTPTHRLWYSLDRIVTQRHILMAWEVEYTDEFFAWWAGLSESERTSVRASVGLLENLGPEVPFPHSTGIRGSRHSHLRELRVQHRGRPYRVLYAFDPRRIAILLIGGDKTGDDRWYRTYVPLAERLYDEHIATLIREGLIDG